MRWDVLSNPLIPRCYIDPTGLTYIAAGAAVIGAIGGGVSLIAQQSAAAQAASNAQAVANYNAQIQQQNAQLQYQIAVQQSQYQAQAAQANAQLMRYNQDVALAQAEQQKQFFEYSARISEANALTSQRLYQARSEEQLRNAKDYELQAEARRAQTREESRRIREEGDQRIAAMRAKYGASGVTFEGSPLVVLSDAARLIETGVQDSAYIGELEARKSFRSAEIERYGAGLTLLESDVVQKNYAREAFEARTNAISAVNLGAAQSYESKISELNSENQILAATYDTHIAAARLKLDKNQADLVRMGGEVQASNIRAESTANLFSGLSNLSSNVAAGFSKSGAYSNLLRSRTSVTSGVQY